MKNSNFYERMAHETGSYILASLYRHRAAKWRSLGD